MTITNYNELVMGVARESSAPYMITEIDAPAATIFARNPYNNEFADLVAFVATSETLTSATCDRKEFIGRNGSLDAPAALRRVESCGTRRRGTGSVRRTSNVHRARAARSPRSHLSDRRSRIKRSGTETHLTFRQAANVNTAFEKVLNHWDELLGTVEVRTPDQRSTRC